MCDYDKDGNVTKKCPKRLAVDTLVANKRKEVDDHFNAYNFPNEQIKEAARVLDNAVVKAYECGLEDGWGACIHAISEEVGFVPESDKHETIN